MPNFWPATIEFDGTEESFRVSARPKGIRGNRFASWLPFRTGDAFSVEIRVTRLSGTESIIIDTTTFNDYNFSEYTHLFKWTPGEKDKGDHEIVIKLTDDFGFTTYHTHKLSVFSNPCVHCDKEDKSTPADTTGN